jgi:hypothetical protein
MRCGGAFDRKLLACRVPGMGCMMNRRGVSAARCDALFVSPLQPSQEPGAQQVRQAAAAAARRFGERGCAVRVAQEFGEHPEAAAARMRWVRQAIAQAFARRGSPGPGQGRPCPHAAQRAA